MAGLAEAIEKAKDQAVWVEQDEMVHLLDEIERLPDEETRRLLAERPE